MKSDYAVIVPRAVHSSTWIANATFSSLFFQSGGEYTDTAEPMRVVGGMSRLSASRR
jgi:hypothetical protein